MLAESAIANFDSAQEFIMAKRLDNAFKAAIEFLCLLLKQILLKYG